MFLSYAFILQYNLSGYIKVSRFADNRWFSRLIFPHFPLNGPLCYDLCYDIAKVESHAQFCGGLASQYLGCFILIAC